MAVHRIVVATRNADKLKEIRPIFIHTGWELQSLLDYPNVPEIIEDGKTLLENAMKKAKASYEWTGLPSLADDTGLEVDALEGAPGVYSNRYAGENATYSDNNQKLLAALLRVPMEKRSARFRCVAVLMDGGRPSWVDGVCEGVILKDLQGCDGFGYDPVFYVPEKEKTFAEMTLEEKNEISHRARAFRKMAALLEKLYREHPVRGVAQSG